MAWLVLLLVFVALPYVFPRLNNLKGEKLFGLAVVVSAALLGVGYLFGLFR